MLNQIDNFYLSQKEPLKSVFLILRDIILSLDNNITNSIKYKMPFFCYKGKMFCYFWIDKKTNQPYIGVVKGRYLNYSELESGNRSHIKILRINTNEDLPIETIKLILNKALTLY